MLKTIIALSVAVLSMTLVSAAHADELPTDNICHIAAEEAYSAAVAAGDGLPDGAYEAAFNACEDAESASLNDVIAVDGEAWFPACRFEGSCK